jgi:hypothetical protein
VNQAHAQLVGRQGGDVFLEGRARPQAAHAGHLARADPPVAHGADPAEAFHQFTRLVADFLHDRLLVY